MRYGYCYCLAVYGLILDTYSFSLCKWLLVRLLSFLSVVHQSHAIRQQITSGPQAEFPGYIVSMDWRKYVALDFRWVESAFLVLCLVVFAVSFVTARMPNACPAIQSWDPKVSQTIVMDMFIWLKELSRTWMEFKRIQQLFHRDWTADGTMRGSLGRFF